MWYKILFFSVVIMSSLLSASYAEEEILIVTEEWPPYNYSEDERITGFSTEVVQHILEILEKNYAIYILPSMRSSAILRERPHTMMFSMFRTPERESRYKWIGPLADASVYFYKRKGDPLNIENLDDMKDVNLSICSRQAGLIHDLLRDKGFHNLDAPATRSLSIYQMLLAGRCDLAISDTDLGVRYDLNLLNLKMDDVLERIPIPIFGAQLYIVASKDISDEEIQQWQQALDTLKANGIYEKIFQTYK